MELLITVSCDLGDRYQYFGGTYYFHLQVRREILHYIIVSVNQSLPPGSSQPQKNASGRTEVGNDDKHDPPVCYS
jgi:hypothetical protein